MAIGTGYGRQLYHGTEWLVSTSVRLSLHAIPHVRRTLSNIDERNPVSYLK